MLAFVMLTAAAAQTVHVDFDASRHVYTWPEGWMPKGVGAAQLDALQETAVGLHYPFYVVYIRGEDLPGTGDGLERLQEAAKVLNFDIA